MSQPEIFSSTGELGTSVRQDNRLYHNAEDVYAADALVDIWQGLEEKSAQMPDISRLVCRAVIGGKAMQEISGSELKQRLEVAVPLSEYGHDGWLVYLARNAEHRVPLTDIAQMVQATSEVPSQSTQTITNGQSIGVIDDSIIESLHGMWSETFGWSEPELIALKQRLEVELREVKPNERSVWFSALELDGHRLASAAMAERIDLPGPDDQPVTLIESTEWRTQADLGRMGLMPAVLRDLNRQIAVDVADQCPLPVVYAECNFTSRSDRAGHRAGFRVPPQQYAAQILVQHVSVNDGILENGLRDFTFMNLPASNLEALR